MFEVEMKFRLTDVVAFERKLSETLHVTLDAVRTESDLYFQRESRDFRETGEALRIRRVGDELRITYKGPRLDQTTKTREEIEIPLLTRETGGSTGDQFPLIDEDRVVQRKEEWTHLLGRLGYSPFAEVEKKRRSGSFSFQGREFNVTSDHLEGIGDFTEIETIAMGEEDLEESRQLVLALAGILDLTESVRTSYLTLYLQSLHPTEKIEDDLSTNSGPFPSPKNAEND